MIKNLSVSSVGHFNVNKHIVHKLVLNLKNKYEFKIISLGINFVDNEKILELNKSYLSHDYTTDIITFNYSGENDKFDGEIFISYEEAITNSRRYKVSLNNELLRLIIHGVLHLLDFDDKAKEDKIIMKKEENKLVNEFKNIIDNITEL